MSRSDLAPGQRAAQAGHACFAFAIDHPDIASAWHPGYLILLEAPDEYDLVALASDADFHGVPFSVFREPDYDDAIGAVALAPTTISAHLCAGLPLMCRDLSGERETPSAPGACLGSTSTSAPPLKREMTENGRPWAPSAYQPAHATWEVIER